MATQMEALVGLKNAQLTAHNLAIHQHSNPPTTRLTVAAFVHAQNQLHRAGAQRSGDSPDRCAQRDSRLKNALHRQTNDGRLHRHRRASHVSPLVNRPTADRSPNPAKEQPSPRSAQKHPSRLTEAQVHQPLLHYSRSDSVPLQPRVSALLPPPPLETVQDSRVAASKRTEPLRRQKKQKKTDKEEKKGKPGKRSEQEKRKRDEKSPSIIDRNHVLKQRKERRQKNKKGTQSQLKPASSTHSSNQPPRKQKGRSKGALRTGVDRLPDLRQPEAVKQRSRMTIEPEASYGIFGKGVSGGSTAARLIRNKPSRDLVFNDLRFLDKKRPRKRSARSRSSRTKSEKKRAQETTDSSVSSKHQELSTRRQENRTGQHRDQASTPSRVRRRITSTAERSRTLTQTWPEEFESYDRSLTPGMHSANSIRLRAAKSRVRRREKDQDSKRIVHESLEVSDHQSASGSLPVSDHNSAGLEQDAGPVPERCPSASPARYLLADSHPYSGELLDWYSNSELDRNSNAAPDQYSNSVLDRYSSVAPEPYSTTISNQYSRLLPDRNSTAAPYPYMTANSNRYSTVVPNRYSTVMSNEYLDASPDWNTMAVPHRFLHPVRNRYSPPPAHDDPQLDRYVSDGQGIAARSVGGWTERTEPDWRQWSVSPRTTRNNYEQWSPGRSSTVELLRGPFSLESETRSSRERNELSFSGQWIEELGGPGVWDSECIGTRVWSETKSEADLGEVGASEDAEEEIARLDQIIFACGGATEQKNTWETSSAGYLEQDVRMGLRDQCVIGSEWQP